MNLQDPRVTSWNSKKTLVRNDCKPSELIGMVDGLCPLNYHPPEDSTWGVFSVWLINCFVRLEVLTTPTCLRFQ